MIENYDPFRLNAWLNNPFFTNTHSIQVLTRFLKSGQMDMVVNFFKIQYCNI